jgi:p21-activated kinase 1
VVPVKAKKARVYSGCHSVVCLLACSLDSVLMTDLLGKEKAPVISTPYDPIHLTHVGFDYNTGQCEFSIVSVVPVLTQ